MGGNIPKPGILTIHLSVSPKEWTKRTRMLWVNEPAQWVQVLVTELDGLSSKPGSPTAAGEK